MPCILVIDDDSMMRAMLRDMLSVQKYEVLEASTSEEGVATYKQNNVDLVITDLFIPSKGGIEIIKELKADNPDVKIIAISGVDVSGFGFRHEIDPKTLAIQSGALRTFKKPFKPTEFIEAVQELLNQQA